MPSDAPLPAERIAAKPQSFEDFRLFLQGSVDQLVAEMARQQVNYMVPHADVLDLLTETARLQGRSVWDEWDSWSLRHSIPVRRLVEVSRTRDLTAQEREVMAKRLHDLLGYVVLGLVLANKGAK